MDIAKKDQRIPYSIYIIIKDFPLFQNIFIF